jgi:hypothetical protein
MSDLPLYLKQLDKLLLNLPTEAMLLSELDGYLTGIVVCPELVMPSEWLPGIWGAEDDEPVFEDSRQAEKLMLLVMEHYNSIARGLNGSSGGFAPVFDVDTRHDEVLWELWIDGFDQAMRLRPTPEAGRVQVLWWDGQRWKAPGPFGTPTMTLDRARTETPEEGHLHSRTSGLIQMITAASSPEA